MKSKDFLFCSTALILVFGFANSASAITYYCNSCSDCESKINSASAGDIVKLTSNIINQNGICITGKNGNVEFDCQGHIIDGDGTGSDMGAYITNANSNTIKNCIISDFGIGINLENSSNNTIINNTQNSNLFDGIDISYFSLNNIIAYNSGKNNLYGLALDPTSTGNEVNNNIFCNNTNRDIYDGDSNTGDNNTCDKPDGWNDQGTTGCAYSCSGATTTTTTETIVNENKPSRENVVITIALIVIGLVAMVLYAWDIWKHPPK